MQSNFFKTSFIKLYSDERRNGCKGLTLKHCKFLQPFFTSCEHDCFCLKTLNHFLSASDGF